MLKNSVIRRLGPLLIGLVACQSKPNSVPVISRDIDTAEKKQKIEIHTVATPTD